MNNDQSTTTGHLRYRQAYQDILSDIGALDPKKLIAVNVDVTNSYTTVIGALDKIAKLRERASHLVEFDVKHFDKLETYALALMHTQGEYVSASGPPEGLLELNEEGIALRENLYSDAVALVRRGLVDGAPLKDFKNAPGYRNLAQDLVGLSSLLRRSWDKIGSRTVVTMAELDRAEDVSERLLRVVAMRENAPALVASAAEKRQQVFTLLANAYDEVRRAIWFLHWHEDDVEDIAPSLYAGRGHRKAAPKKALPPAATTGSAAPVDSAPAPLSSASAQTPSAADNGSGPVPQNDPFAKNLN